MQIGDILYTRDTNRRVRDSNHAFITAHYWREHIIIGETRDSWILQDGARTLKAAKNDLRLRLRELYGMDSHAYTPETKADREWLDTNRMRLVDMVRVADVATLRRVAAVLDDAGE